MTSQSRLQLRVSPAYQSIESASVLVESDAELYDEDREKQEHCSRNDACVQFMNELNHESYLKFSGIMTVGL